MTSSDDETAKFRDRQGPGARYDAASAPAVALKWARRGTAYFARKLNELSDEEFDGATVIPGWSRRRLIAHVGYQARALSRIVEAARTGERCAFASEGERAAELDHGETLPHRALRHLFYHSEVHLNVEWRDIPNEGWETTVPDVAGEPLPIRDTPFIRASAVWIHAVDLNNHGSLRDFPRDFLDALTARIGPVDRRVNATNPLPRPIWERSRIF